MSKKHGSVTKLHTCSGLDSHNEQKHWHSRCHYKRNSGSVPAGMNNLHTREPAGRRVPGDSPATSAAAAMAPGRTRPPEGSRSRSRSRDANQPSKPKSGLLQSAPAGPRSHPRHESEEGAECCILAGQQQFAFPGMVGGCLLHRAGGWLPPPEAGRRGGQPACAGGRAPARLALRPSKDDGHP
jgi:hypothetical protein